MSLIRLLSLALCLTAAAPAARAEVRALLIGVGDYSHIDADLRGPAHDVALMAETLVARGVAPGAITALTTDAVVPGLPAGLALGQPTRAAILSAMAALDAASAPGDMVLFHFSGHGSQAPDRSGDEMGGADEILLPMDARGWRGAVADVENAILDDELQDWARGMLARGVQVVGVIDACHSGTGFRALGGAGVARQIEATALGVPEDAAPPPGMPAAAPAPDAPLPGDFAFLYAAQPDQRAFEFPLDPAAPDGPWHGAFTLALAQTLRDSPGATWAQVLVAARGRMAEGPARQEPDGEGPLMEAPVFGQGAPSGRVALRDGALAAGLLDGLAPGATVALYAAPAGGEALATARVARATARDAALDAPPPPGAAWAEVVAPAPPPPLRLAPPVRADAGDGQDYGPVLAALDAALAEGIAVIDAAAPDAVPVLAGGTLALAAGDGALDPLGPRSTPRATPRPDEDAAAATLRLIENAAHAARLSAVLTGLAGRGAGAAKGLAVATERRPGRATPDGCGPAGAALPWTPGDPAEPCDELWLTIDNRTGRSLDVTVFYRAQDFTLTPIWPVQALSNRLDLGETARVGLRLDAPAGTHAAEEILVIATDPGPDGSRAPLARLATPDRLRDTRGGGAAVDAVASLLDGTTTRGFGAARPPLMLIRQAVRLRPPAAE